MLPSVTEWGSNWQLHAVLFIIFPNYSIYFITYLVSSFYTVLPHHHKTTLFRVILYVARVLLNPTSNLWRDVCALVGNCGEKLSWTYENSSVMVYLSPLAVRMATTGSSPLGFRPNSDNSWLNMFLLATAKFSFLPWSRKPFATFITLKDAKMVLIMLPKTKIILWRIKLRYLKKKKKKQKDLVSFSFLSMWLTARGEVHGLVLNRKQNLWYSRSIWESAISAQCRFKVCRETAASETEKHHKP